MAIQPNPCLDSCQFEYNTATGKSRLRLNPAGGISCGDDGLEVASAVYVQHSAAESGSVAVAAPLGSVGVLAPASFVLTAAFTIPGLADFIPAHDEHVLISATADTMIIANAGAGEAQIELFASIDGGTNWTLVHFSEFHNLGGGAVGYNSGSVMAQWDVPASFNCQPRFLLGHTEHSGASPTTAFVKCTRVDAVLFAHRKSTGAL